MCRGGKNLKMIHKPNLSEIGEVVKDKKIAMLLEGGQDVCQIVMKKIRFICKLSELIHAQNTIHQE